jgi:hypothetical protein
MTDEAITAAVQALQKVDIQLPEAVQHGLLHRRCVNLRRCLLDLPSADNVRLFLQATFPWAEATKNEFDPVVPCLGQMTSLSEASVSRSSSATP